MTETEHCPRCGKSLVVHGSMFRRGSFRPEGLKLLSLSFQIPEVPIPAKASACASCGLVWCELDAALLRQKLHDLGNEEIKQRLGLAESP